MNIRSLELDFSSAAIGSVGASVLVEVLSCLPSVPTQVNIMGNRLADEDGETIFLWLAQEACRHVVGIKCYKNEFGARSGEAAISFLTGQHSLTAVSLASNPLPTGFYMRLLAAGSELGPLQVLTLRGEPHQKERQPVEVGEEAASFITSNRTVTYFQPPPLNRDGIEPILRALEANTSITVFGLTGSSCAGIGPAVAHVLEKNSVLTCLDVRDVGLTEEDGEAIVSALEQNTSVTLVHHQGNAWSQRIVERVNTLTERNKGSSAIS